MFKCQLLIYQCVSLIRTVPMPSFVSIVFQNSVTVITLCGVTTGLTVFTPQQLQKLVAHVILLSHSFFSFNVLTSHLFCFSGNQQSPVTYRMPLHFALPCSLSSGSCKLVQHVCCCMKISKRILFKSKQISKVIHSATVARCW